MLLDAKTAEEMKTQRTVDMAYALSKPKVKAAFDVILEHGIEPSIAHGCLTYLRQQKNPPPTGDGRKDE